MHFQVLTLDMAAFIETCRKLQHIVEDAGYKADVVVAVPRGGCRVVDSAFESYKKYAVTLIRPENGRLKKRFGRIVRLLPMQVRDCLRIIEANVLVKRSNHMLDTELIMPEIDEEVKCVLIVDDAVDSGATLKAVVDKFKTVFPDKEIKTAAITVTGKKVMYYPDFCVYNNGTLIRTPWSIDMN